LNHLVDSLENVLDSMTQNVVYPRNNCVIQDNFDFFFPINFVIHTTENLDEDRNELLIKRSLQALNQDFENAGISIRFIQACTELNNSPDQAIVSDDSEGRAILTAFDTPGIFDLHIVDHYEGANGVQFPSIPFVNPEGIFVRYAELDSPTLTHEFGHLFGLDHPHQFTEGNIWCLREPVSRNRPNQFFCNFLTSGLIPACSVTGDGLCDTPADPADRLNIDDCIYVGNERDYRGERFNPDISNFMSIYPDACRENFSTSQILIMRFNTLNRAFPLIDDLSNLFSNTPVNLSNNNMPDIFEPDNFPRSSTLLVPDVVQEHNFDDFCETDSDWFRVEINNLSGTYEVFIESFDDCPFPVDLVEVWNSNIFGESTFLVPDVIITQSADRIKIELDCTNDFDDGDVRIRLANSSDEGGIYKIWLEENNIEEPPQIIGINSIPCNPSFPIPFSVALVPPNAIVNWGATGGVVLSNNSGISTNIVSAPTNTTSIALEATIRVGDCEIRLRKEISVEDSSIGDITDIRFDFFELCPRIFYQFHVEPVDNAIIYEWETTPSFPFTGQGSNLIEMHSDDFPPGQQSFILEVTATNSCGVSTDFSTFFTLDIPEDGECLEGSPQRTISISPNPASNLVTIQINETDEDLVGTIEYNLGLYTQYGNYIEGVSTYNNTHQFNVSNYNEGYYIIQLSTENQVQHEPFTIYRN